MTTKVRAVPASKGSSGPLGLLAEFQTDPLGLLGRLHREHGDIARGRFLWVDNLFVFRPEYVKRVLLDNNKNYRKDPFTTGILRFFGQDNLFTGDGDFWLRQRRLMQPMFHRQRITGFGKTMAEGAADMLDGWERRRAANPGEVFWLNDEMMQVTMRIVGQALFSEDLSAEASRLGQAFNDADHYISFRFKNPAWQTWFPGRRNAGARIARDTVVTRIREMIARRRLSGERRDDLLSMLIEARDEDTGAGLDDEQIRREAGVMIAAGHETTAAALTWAFYLLATHPKQEARLQAEIAAVLGRRAATIDDVSALTYTRQVIDETLRLYPPAWATARQAIGEDALGPFHVPAGMNINIPIHAIHHSPVYWERPEDFEPERFAPERTERQERFSYLPFGGGPRQCIGNMFALTEATLILAAVIQRYQLHVVSGHAVRPEPVLTLNTSAGLPVTLQPR